MIHEWNGWGCEMGQRKWMTEWEFHNWAGQTIGRAREGWLKPMLLLVWLDVGPKKGILLVSWVLTYCAPSRCPIFLPIDTGINRRL
jgi:hypothetical protein